MERASSESVYSLVTQLCEKHLDATTARVTKDGIKRLRKHAFDGLLQPGVYRRTDAGLLENCDNIHGKFAIWCHKLRFKHEFHKIADDIDECLTEFDGTEAILRFLIELREKPTHKGIKEIRKASTNRLFSWKQFELIESNDEDEEFMDDNRLGAALEAQKQDEDESEESASRIFFNWTHFQSLSKPERLTWESFPEVRLQPELPFVSEMDANCYIGFIDELGAARSRSITTELLHAHLKLLVVGMDSTTYILKNNSIVLNANVTCNGMTNKSLKRYSRTPIKCGTMYARIVKRMESLKVLHKGCIFLEFFNAVERYLILYRVSLINYPMEHGLYKFHDAVRKLYRHLRKVNKITSDCETMFHGVQIINYLCRSISAEADRSVVLLLSSFFHPLLKIYVNNFLYPWIMDGAVNDKFKEFFIHPKETYSFTCERFFWTRAFQMQDELVPDFLENLSKLIFNCGKTMAILNRCVPHSPLGQYLAKERPILLQCCITAQQVRELNVFVRKYRMDVLNLRGAPFSIQKVMQIKHDEQLLFMKLALQQRASTIRRIEEEKVNREKKLSQMKLHEINKLKEEYDKAVANNARAKMLTLERDISEIESLRAIQECEERLVKEEAENMISHYVDLVLKADNLYLKMDISRKASENITLTDSSDLMLDQVNANDNCSASNALLDNELVLETEKSTCATNVTQEIKESSRTALQINRENILGSQIFFLRDRDRTTETNKHVKINENETDMMMERVSEYRSNYSMSIIQTPIVNNETTCEGNTELKNLTNEEEVSLDYTALEQNGTINEAEEIYHNISSHGESDESDIHEESIEGSDAGSEGGIDEQNNLELELQTSDTTASLLPTGWRTCFNFEIPSSSHSLLTPFVGFPDPAPRKSDQVISITNETVEQFDSLYFEYFLKECLFESLKLHYDFIRNEVLKYFVVELKCIDYFECLRNMYLLLDGEYSRNLCDTIFRRMYDDSGMAQLIHVCSLNLLIKSSLESAFKSFDVQNVSFFIRNEPREYDLHDVYVLDCISLVMNVEWPLNIIIPSSVIDKYDEIFKFLMKINRAAWVLKQIWIDMKTFASECTHRELFHLSPQCQKVHLFRYTMLHFIEAFKRYIAEEVLHTCWSEMIEALNKVEDIDDLHKVHTDHVKQIYFLCMLTRKAEPIRLTVMNIFIVILKVYEYFRTRSWKLTDAEYRHPNFWKITQLFYNFLQLVSRFLKDSQKVMKSYQPQLHELVNLIDANGFYGDQFLGNRFDQTFEHLGRC